MSDEKNESKLLPPIYENWLAFLANKPSQSISEYPLFSDAVITGENTTDFGPYQFLNPCPNRSSKIRPVLILRVDSRLAYGFNRPCKTDFGYYHGGDLVDEIAAFVSLCLGARFKAGGQTRVFQEKGDRFGRPIQYAEKIIPNIFPEYNIYKLPTVLGLREIISLEPLKYILNISKENLISLIRAARLYQDSLWIAESEPSLAWVMLVSAIEVVAHQWKKDSEPPEQLLQYSKPDLHKYLKDNIKEEEKINKIAELLANICGSTKKFVNFTLEFMPPASAKRPPPAFQHSWEKDKMEDSLRKIYDHRSNALHGGIPFPFSMCESPYWPKGQEMPAEIPIGLGTFCEGGSWRIEDTPLVLNTFEYIVRNCLLNWMKSIGTSK